MADPVRDPSQDPAVDLRINLRLAAAWLAAAWQDLWRRLWAATAALAAFVALALTDVLPGLPGWLHILILIAVLGGIGGLAARAVRGFRWPTRDGARAWLESAAADLHRPLTTVEDRPALAASAFERALWQAHQDRARARLDELRVNPPAPGVAARDRLALRAAAIVALAIAIVGAGPDAPGRLVRALMPAFDGGSADLTVKLWITPPVYTNRSPIYLEHPAAEGTVDAAATIDVPEGSKALVVVTGTARDTVLAADDAEFPLERLADSSLRLETPLPSARALALTQRGRVIAAWSLNPLADLPPEIAWTREPAEAGRWRLRLDYRAVDDYGIARAVARISAGPELPAALAATAAEDAVEVELNTPPFNPKEAASASFHDLTAHPWAGFPVEIELAVTDQAEQTAVSEKLSAVLPERAFEHPVARELAAARKALFLDLAGAIRPVRGSLGRILQDPSAFGGDARVYLALSTARARLGLNGPEVAVRPLADLLWQAAIRIEDGNLVAAEQRLEAAEQALREAMERGATPAEISRLIDQLQRALAEYTRELAARMPEGEMSALTPPQDQQMFGPEDIAATMERLRQLAEMGAEDAARQMLSELQNMLQTLRSAAAAKNDNPTLRKAQDIMKDLRQLAEDQARLMEDSFQKAREQALDSIGGREPRPRREAGPRGRPQAPQDQAGDEQAGEEQDGGEQGGEQEGEQESSALQADMGGGAAQERLRSQLGDVMGRMAELAGQVPDGLGNAEGAMRRARDALDAQAFKPAADAQGEALAELQQSLQQANDQLMQALQQQGLAGLMPMPGPGQRGFDPLGRRTGPDNGEDIELPAGPDPEGTAERVRAILEEIRRRAADRTRPTGEQDYLRRLMKQF